MLCKCETSSSAEALCTAIQTHTACKSDIHHLSVPPSYRITHQKTAWRAYTCSMCTQSWLACVLDTSTSSSTPISILFQCNDHCDCYCCCCCRCHCRHTFLCLSSILMPHRTLRGSSMLSCCWRLTWKPSSRRTSSGGCPSGFASMHSELGRTVCTLTAMSPGSSKRYVPAGRTVCTLTAMSPGSSKSRCPHLLTVLSV